MDKADFLKIAPSYYMLALVLKVEKSSGQYFSELTLREEYGDGLIGNSNLLQQAVDTMAKNDAIEVLVDPFGPTLYRKGPEYAPYVKLLEGDENGPFHKSKLGAGRKQWLESALASVNSTCMKLGITHWDYKKPDVDWSPLPLDRKSETLKTAIAAIDKTVTEVEQNNGYAATYPEERNFVLDNLRMLANTLKTAITTSVNYVTTHGLSVLQKLQYRFVDATIGETAKETAKLIAQWLKEAAKSLLS